MENPKSPTRRKPSKIVIAGMGYNENSGLLHCFLEVLIRYGQFVLAFSFSIVRIPDATGKSMYFLRSNTLTKILTSVMYYCICHFLLVQIIGENFNVTKYPLINLIKRATHCVFLIQLLAYRLCFECEKRKQLLVEIVNQADVIQETFANFGLQFCSKIKTKIFAYIICIIAFFSWIIHMSVFTALHSEPHWTSKSCRKFLRAITLNLIELEDGENPVGNVALRYIFASLGLLLEVVCWHLWYFGDCLRIFTVIAVWTIFNRLNLAVDSEELTFKELPEIVDLHLKATKLMTMINNWISPITFLSTVYTLVYSCFWTNYIVQDFLFNPAHVICILFLTRNMFIFLLSADVNTKAHQISFWLEKKCSENEKFPVIDRTKMTIFIAQLYNRDTIGFKGLNYFTITSTFISGVVGLVITYTVIVTQFVLVEVGRFSGKENDAIFIAEPHHHINMTSTYE